MLVVIHRDEDLAWLSLRNAVAVHAIAVDQLNAYDVLVNDEVVFTSAALDAYVAGPTAGKAAKSVARESETVDEPSNAELAAASAARSPSRSRLQPLRPSSRTTWPSRAAAEPTTTAPARAEVRSRRAASTSRATRTR